jgi:hypothetical protein
MNTSKFLLFAALSVALFMVVPATAFVPTFTGNVETDFPDVPGNGVLIVTDPGGQEVYVTNQPGGGLTPGSGWDIKDLRLAYNPGTDTLYVGLNSYNIVGDADGDGDPGHETWGGGVDYAELAGSETVAVYFDLDMVGPFNMGTSWDVIVGVGGDMIFSDFGIYNTRASSNPSSNFQFPASTYPTGKITGHDGLTPTDPSAASPDWEFSMTNFSTLLQDSAVGTADIDPGSFRVGAFMGSIDDGAIGEDFIYYHQIPSTIVTITPTPGAVIEGGTVSLEVTEENNSEAYSGQQAGPSDPQPYAFLPAQVAVTQNGSPISASPLGAPPDSGDTANTGVLDIGETWIWGTVTTITSDPINATTTFVAHGSGTGPQGFVHTYVQDPDEEDQADVVFLSTDVGISASATAVGIDGTVDLTVTEHNDGDEDLTNVSVAISYDNGGGSTPLVILTAPPTSGDTGNDGILGVGETWMWDASTVIALNDFPITATTTFTATGSAQYDSIIVTYPDDLDEQDEVTVAALSTDVGISASPTTVPIGGTVDLTVTEHNDGDEDLTSVSVAVTYDNGGGSTPLVILTAPPTSGDAGNDGILGVGETWTWDASTVIALNDFPITATTTFTATGSAQYDSITVTYPGDLDEQDSVTVTPSSPGTSISIVADNTLVCEGDTVTLTICEQNDGQIDLTNVAVVVYYDDGGGETLLVALPATPDSGDTADTGVLNQGETWCWNVADVPVTVSTTFIAYGYGEFDGYAVTWCENPTSPPTAETFCDQDERNEVTVDTQPCGGEGCTPGFWKENAENWNHSAWVGHLPTDKFNSVFGRVIEVRTGGKKSNTVTNPTLLEALNANGGQINALARAAVAALLNISSGCINYGIGSEAELITMVQQAIDEEDWSLAGYLDDLNNAGCPISQHQQGNCI